jgi:hypothetical protein
LIVFYRAIRLLKVLWVLPVSVFALPLLPLALTWPLPQQHRARWSINNGVLEIESPALSWFLQAPWFRALSGGSGFAAATIGHVIIGRDKRCLEACRTHEHVHVRQCERWGPLFPVAYVLAGLFAACKARRFDAYYRDNAFEVEARAAEACKT